MTVTLATRPGFGGEIGDLLYDGDGFTFLTPPEIWKERTRRSPRTPRIRQWNEYRASTLPAGEA